MVQEEVKKKNEKKRNNKKTKTDIPNSKFIRLLDKSTAPHKAIKFLTAKSCLAPRPRCRFNMSRFDAKTLQIRRNTLRLTFNFIFFTFLYFIIIVLSFFLPFSLYK